MKFCIVSTLLFFFLTGVALGHRESATHGPGFSTGLMQLPGQDAINSRHPRSLPSTVPSTSPWQAPSQDIDCGRECDRRCSKAGRRDRCLTYCLICCEKCHCVPPGTFGNKEVCPCYANLKNSKGGSKCP